MNIELMMELAEFPEADRAEVRSTYEILAEKGKCEEVKAVAKMLTEIPSETEMLGKELEKQRMLWEAETGIHRYMMEF